MLKSAINVFWDTYIVGEKTLMDYQLRINNIVHLSTWSVKTHMGALCKRLMITYFSILSSHDRFLFSCQAINSVPITYGYYCPYSLPLHTCFIHFKNIIVFDGNMEHATLFTFYICCIKYINQNLWFQLVLKIERPFRCMNNVIHFICVLFIVQDYTESLIT